MSADSSKISSRLRAESEPAVGSAVRQHGRPNPCGRLLEPVTYGTEGIVPAVVPPRQTEVGRGAGKWFAVVAECFIGPVRRGVSPGGAAHLL